MNEDLDIVAKCDWCGKSVTPKQVTKMPSEHGVPVFIVCMECETAVFDATAQPVVQALNG